MLAASIDAAPTAPTFVLPPRELVYFGHVMAVKRVGARFELRVDPALWLQGKTATRAAIDDRAIPPGEVVPNDY